MRQRLSSIFFLIILAMAISFHWAYARDVSYSDSPRDIIIQLKTIPDTGYPMMRLTAVPIFTLYGDGRVIYSRPDLKNNIHLYETKLNPNEIQKLLRYIRYQGFNSFNDNYMPVVLSDMDITYLTVNIKENQKSIKIFGFRLAAYQNELPRGLNKIYKALSEFKREKEILYNPEKISLFVALNRGELPRERKIIKWRVKSVRLRRYCLKKIKLSTRFNETEFTGKEKDDLLSFLNNKTLYQDREGFVKNFFKEKRRLYKVGFRPHLPYE